MNSNHPTPLKAIRLFCLACVGHNAAEVHRCGGDKPLGGGRCNLYPYRLGKGRPSVKTIRRECLSCCCGSRDSVAACPSEACPIWPYRFGKNPARTGQGRSENLFPNRP